MNLYQLVKALYHRNSKATLKELSDALELSENTIKSMIKNNKDTAAKYGFKLNMRLLKCSLELLDVDLFAEYMRNNNRSQDDRVSYIITRLLKSDDFIKIEDISNELYVSRATLDRLMPTIKEIAETYRLGFISKPKYGIFLEGNEMDKRLCLTNYRIASQLDGSLQNKEKDEVSKIQAIVLESIRKHALFFNDINLYNLIQHIFVAIKRICSGNAMNETPNVKIDHDIQNETAAAEEICDALEREYQITINDSEKYYILIHLLGKRTFQNINVIDEAVFRCVDEIFLRIKAEKNIDFRGDAELATSLALHIQPLLLRLQFGLRQQNPILLQIKREMINGYEIALCASQVFHELYSADVDEEEIGYLAVYFTMALERMKNNAAKKKVAVICSTGRGTAKLIQYKLVQRYKYRIEDILLISLYELETMDLANIECIISSLPLYKDYGIPVFYLSAIIDETFEEVDSFFKSIHVSQHLDLIDERLLLNDVDCKTREEAIRILCDKIKEVHQVDLYDEVMKREALSSTEVGKLLAIPHPYQYNHEHTILAMMKLKKEIKWKYKKVAYVLFSAIPASDKNGVQISETIARISLDSVLLKNMMNDLTKENVEKVFGGLEE